MKPINWRFAAHPMNWVIIFLMLLIAGTFGHYCLSLLRVEPTTANSWDNVPAGLAPVDATN